MTYSRIVSTAFGALLVGACAQLDVATGPAPGEPSADYRTVGEVRYQAQTAVLESFPVQLRTTVTATNVGGRTEQIEFPNGCPVLLRAYRTAARVGQPAWDQARDIVCTLALEIVSLRPGEARTFLGRATATEILGDSLPNGRYYLSAVIRPNGGAVELNAGEADLAR